ncbi:MAG TPA: tRNA (N6-threonylcarbamoyladenosine(37)-N6)-methyltransferase TrmO [Deltaproteobacteria bacterium]|nr:tRNA (N6-threonylcarbamoyladenosine(37)-N6)-methyltransferase TrmO [Deltaproteobacteria bacterium]HPJ95049.1 tRNA (N6-threonylcarbamoyladenosine(37)-N6)-methyltransferase TrmO [Deltaproteobacteria bacterium]HPR52545.1 tRNA (N6-threonylcarbamoyladenosine(37)-N6)-methyltransferase TrmO [Deltaproteobacteria bacterium]
MKICYEPIGVMHCELEEAHDAPRFYNVSDIKGTIEIYEPYLEGLYTLEEHEYIVAIFHFHRSEGYTLKQTSPTGRYRGVFALCSPMRPNAIGMSILKLIKVVPPLIYVEKVDMLNGTPILDIKPYKPLEECSS